MASHWLSNSFAIYRANRIANHLSRFVQSNETVLDCGCGSMLISEMLQERHRVNAFGTDVIRLNQTNDQFCLCSGEILPFQSGSFDSVFLISTLHHMSDPVRALQEGLRVTRSRLIVIEDVYRSPLEFRLLKILDWCGNIAISKDMSFPFNFKTEAEWKLIFEGLKTELIIVENIRPIPWRPSRHRLFVLQKNNT